MRRRCAAAAAGRLRGSKGGPGSAYKRGVVACGRGWGGGADSAMVSGGGGRGLRVGDDGVGRRNLNNKS